MDAKQNLPAALDQISGIDSYAEFSGHELVVRLTDEETNLEAFVALHSTARGPALGGTRMRSYDSETEAISDVLSLSKAMSYKCALANLPYGGGKAVIRENGGNKRDQLKAYAVKVNELRDLFKTGTDVGISDDDVVFMSQFCSNMLGVSGGDRAGMSTSKSAALGVYYAVRSTAKHLGQKDLHQISVAIKGAGKLGGELARLLQRDGARIVVADIDQDQIRALTETIGDVEVVSVDDIHKQSVDIYSPCALGNELTKEVIGQLNCRAVAGGANNQLPSEAEATALDAKGIAYAPDYIANAGGLIYVADELEQDGFQRTRVESRIRGIEDTMDDIFRRSSQEKIRTHKIADTIAQERIKNA